MSAQRLTFPLCDWPNNPRLSPVAVRVNEINIQLYGRSDVATWWFECYRRATNAPRICIEHSTVPGDVLHIHCENRDHADWMHDHLLAQGINKAAIKVIRTSCGATP